MIKHWKKFQSGPVGPKRHRLHVTLSKRGVILMNHNLYDMFGSPEAAYLLYDEEQKLIGIQPTSSGNQFSFPIRSKPGATHHTINAQAFCRAFRIEPPRTVYFIEPDLDHEGILVLDLNRAGEVTTWTRKPKMSVPSVNG